MAHCAARPEQQNRHHLELNGVDTRFKVSSPGRLEAECAVYYRQAATGEPYQAVAIGMCYTSGLESETIREHHKRVPLLS
ncbi:MAG: hypothetical protein OXH92_05535 [Bryobacterales bacterium]|nr:hypothetical protein [Bryobacterales bacterium]MDE0295196.1 hypothetical protein [Bryobacterales bacterium]MDE0433451.1 hypothetical protein [Bryobacterales bacterium]